MWLSKRIIVHLENERLGLPRRVTEERDDFLVLRVCARASGAPAREESGARGSWAGLIIEIQLQIQVQVQVQVQVQRRAHTFSYRSLHVHVH